MDSMDVIASALKPIPALVWGERAIAELGARIICDDYILIIDDENMTEAAHKLQSAGFRKCTWSFGSVDPDFYQDGVKRFVYRSIVHQFSNLDQISSRFFLPPPDECYAKVVLLPSSYAHAKPGEYKSKTDASSDNNVLYPDSTLLVQSIAQTRVREPIEGMWTSILNVWAISYCYGELMLEDGILDSLDDDKAKAWFDKKIRRYEGGMDRTRTKRFGRLGYDGP